MNATQFRAELETLINKHSMENGSDTPDFVLADYLAACLQLFDKTVRRRAEFYGTSLPGAPVPANVQPEERSAESAAPAAPLPIERCPISDNDCVKIAEEVNASADGTFSQIDSIQVKRIALGLDRHESHPAYQRIAQVMRPYLARTYPHLEANQEPDETQGGA